MEKWLTESNSQRKNILENQKEIRHYKVMKPVLNIEKKNPHLWLLCLTERK